MNGVRDGQGSGGRDRGATIDELLDRAVAAINRGDRAAAAALAGQVLAVDGGNADAEDLLAEPSVPGELRRLTIFFADLVDSTALSSRLEPETYRLLVGRYREMVLRIVNRYEGHISSTKGDGLLAVFGHPIAHEDDVRRAVQAGLEITREVARLSDQSKRRFGIGLDVRVGVHRGLVYLDTTQDDVYGFAANLAARVSGLAPPGAVVVSDAVAPLIGTAFKLSALPPAAVKGVDGLIKHSQVIGERTDVEVVHGPLVGRDRELARLEKDWTRAQAGTLTTPGIVLRGEPGMGKSRLAAAATARAENSGAAVLELSGSPFHTDAGLYPVRTLIERRCGIGRLADQAERLRRLEAEVRDLSLDPGAVPLLAPVLGVGAEAGYQAVPAEGRRLYELITATVHDYLLACLGDGVGLVVAEDVHWFDASTLEVLGALLESGGGRLLVTVTGRPGGWLPADWPVKVLDLAPLSEQQTDALITMLNPGLSSDARVAVARRCDGVPFYVEQVVDGITETGVPEALYEPLFARLRATANVVPVVEAAAVIGRHLDRGLLCSVVDLSDEEVDDVIDELEDARVLEPWGTHGWRFRHELLREVAAELAPPSVRRGLHAKVADALVTGGDPDWRLVAGHYERAERFDEAAAAYQQASLAGRRRGALTEAWTYLTQAIALVEHAPPGPGRDRREVAARLERGFLATAAEGYQSPSAAADFERCLQLRGTDLRDDELIATLTALGGYYSARGDLDRAAQVLEILRAGLEEGREWFRPVVQARAGVVAFLRGEFDSAASHLEAATSGMASADQTNIDAVWFMPTDPIALAFIYLAWARLVRGDLDGAEADLARAAGRAAELGFPQGPFSLGYLLSLEAGARVETGQLDRAMALAADLDDLAERHGFGMFRLYATVWQATGDGLTALSADDQDPNTLASALEALATIMDTLRSVALVLFITFFDAVLGRLLIAAGRLDEARQRLDAALAEAQHTGMHFYDAELLRLRAQTHVDPEQRRADIAAALELARGQGATLFELRAALDDHELGGHSARTALVDLVSRMPNQSGWSELARARAALDQYP